MRTSTIAPILVLFSLPLHAQVELLQEVSDRQSQRLEEYNSVFLQKELYFASRYRIVRANVNLLHQQRNITVTPFDDIESIQLIHEETKSLGENAIFWRGRVNFGNDQLFELTGFGIPANISMFAWDLDEDDTALSSSENRFEFSPEWEFDEAGNPKSAGDVIASTPPPQTPVLRPLRYTPKYSVMYEIAPDTVIPIRIDRAPGEPDTRSPTEVALYDQYREFVESLPREEGKQIRADIP